MNTRIISGMLLFWERQPIRYEMNEPQSRNGNYVEVCGFFLWFDLASDWSGHD